MKSLVCKYVGKCRPPGSRIFPLKGAMPDTCFARAAKRAGLPRGLAPGPFPDDYHCLRKNENCTLP